jgi:hypothetical protein
MPAGAAARVRACARASRAGCEGAAPLAARSSRSVPAGGRIVSGGRQGYRCAHPARSANRSCACYAATLQLAAFKGASRPASRRAHRERGASEPAVRNGPARPRARDDAAGPCLRRRRARMPRRRGRRGGAASVARESVSYLCRLLPLRLIVRTRLIVRGEPPVGAYVVASVTRVRLALVTLRGRSVIVSVPPAVFFAADATFTVRVRRPAWRLAERRAIGFAALATTLTRPGPGASPSRGSRRSS